MFADLYKSVTLWNIAILCYFNPVGSHESGLIGEDPNGIPNNLIPFISQVAVGKLKSLSVFCDDYDTKDGIGVRDYIHVFDLALGHLKALEKLKANLGLVTYNLAAGIGYSVLNMVDAFVKASNNNIHFQISPRCQGEIAQCYVSTGLVECELDCKAVRNIDDMCQDAWN